MSLSIIKNENGFLSDIEFNKKALKMLPIYTQDQTKALVVYASFYHVLKFKLSNFEFHKCELLEVVNYSGLTMREKIKKEIRIAKVTRELEKQAWAFDTECGYIKKISYLNLIRSDIVQHQSAFIEFFNSAKFLTCGDLSKKDAVKYQSLCDQLKCNVSKRWLSNNIRLTFKAGGFEHGIYIILDNTDRQKIEDLPKVTLSAYKKAIAKIARNDEKIAALKTETVYLKSDMYL